MHRNFKEALNVKPGFSVEGIHGGQLLGVRGTDFIAFYDWATGKVRRRWCAFVICLVVLQPLPGLGRG